MRIVSINVGRPRFVEWRGEQIRTSIFKSPVDGPVMIRAVNVDGDEQSDLSVHGGVDKAVYVYPSEHYDYWRNELPPFEYGWGAFGENLTTEGLNDSELCIGDHLRVGSTELRITQPRMPCVKMSARFQRADMVKRFQQSGRNGFYTCVVREGTAAAGDVIEIMPGNSGVTVEQIAQLYSAREPNPDLLKRAMDLPTLPADWRKHFSEKLARLS